MNNALRIKLPNGNTYTIGPSTDSRVRFTVDSSVPFVCAVSSQAAEELASEAKAWGVTGVRFGV